MKSLVAGLLAVAVFAMAGTVLAAEAAKAAKPAAKPAPEVVTVVGTVSVAKDAKGEVTGVELKVENGATYDVKLNDEGKKLEADNGKKVEATGTVTEKAGKKWLNVKSSKVVEATAAK